jgi:phosphoglycolate phosphatase
VLDRYRDIPGSQWLSVGDSWIDGKGSNEAGIPFVSYQTELHVMVDRGVKAIGKIGQISELLAYARRE